MPRKQEYAVKLTEEEKEYLLRNTSSGNWTAREVKRAWVLLKADKNQECPMSDIQISKELRCSHAMVNDIREKFVKERLGAIYDKPRSGRPKTIDGEVEAHIIATACSSPPEGRVRWTLELIAEKVVTLAAIEECSLMSVSRTLKKMNLSLG